MDEVYGVVACVSVCLVDQVDVVVVDFARVGDRQYCAVCANFNGRVVQCDGGDMAMFCAVRVGAAR